MIDKQFVPYAIVALTGAIALFHFCANIRKYAPKTSANLFFRASILASATCALMEVAFVFHESGLITNLIFCYGTEITYSAASLISGFCWFMSSELEQQSKTVSTLTTRILCSIPISVMGLIDITTPWHHLLFYFTTDGHYERGVLSVVFVAITGAFIAKSGIFALVRSFERKNYLKRSLYRTFFYYAAVILVAQIFQVVLGSVLPFRIIGAVFVFFMVQEKVIKANVFVDLVTGANNRNAMDRYLKNNFENADSKFTFIMIDLDNFKGINDQYGHNMGDVALKLVSEAFIKAIPPKVFFGRFGGDEFVIIGDAGTTEEIANMMETVKINIKNICERENVLFCPEFSYGIAYKTVDIDSIPSLISCADTAMYAEKQKHKENASKRNI